MAGAINELRDQLGFCRSNGDWEEESRCLNALASRYKTAGHYVKAIQFLEEDYRMLKKRKLSDKEKLDLLLPSVQSLGELHNGRGNFELGLKFQHEHRNMALALSHLDPSCRELQRAECQLGVAYMDMADREREDPQKSESLTKLAKQHLTEALQLASANNLQKALVDAHNNMALLAMQTDDLTLAMSHLSKGLRLCDNLYPDSEARLHHGLGMLFSKQGNKREAAKHIRKDIEICHQIKHLQGEGKAFLTLGDLHCKFHSYEDAIDAYRKAESIFRSLADEDESVKVAQNNIDVAIDRRAAKQELDEAPKELGKLDLRLAEVKGTEKESALQTRKAKRLKELVEVANRVDDFEKARAYAEQLADLASWLGDLGLQADASTAVGEAYYNLQKYSEAEKWHRKSFNYSQAINSAEGMAVAMTNIGNCLDWLSQPEAAVRAYHEGYKKAKEGNLLDQQITAAGNMLCVLERTKDSGEIKKWTKELQRLEKLQKDQRRAGAVQKKRAEQPDEAPVQKRAPATGAVYKSAPATGGVKPGPLLFGCSSRGSQQAVANPVRKAAPADSVKAPPREPYKAERSEMEAYGMKPKDRIRQRSPPRRPKEVAAAGAKVGDKKTETRENGGVERGAGTSGGRGGPDRKDSTRNSGGGDVAAGKTATGAKVKKESVGQSPSGMLDRWLGKGAEGQPHKKQRREQASSAGGGNPGRKAVGGVSGAGTGNEAPSQNESGAAAKDGAAVKELLTKQRRRVIEEDDESEDEDSPMVVKRRRVDTGAESAEKNDFGRGLREGERNAGEVSGRTGDRNGSGTTAATERKKGTIEADALKAVTREWQSDVSDAQGAPGVAVSEGRDRQTDRPKKTALTEITNRGPQAEPASKPAANKGVPCGTSSGAVPEDLLETQRVDPLTQMGDSEVPLEEEDLPDALPENPVRFSHAVEEACGPSKGSQGESKRTPGGLAGSGLGEKRLEETAGPSGTRPFDLNEHSSAGPETGRKSIASGKEATSGNTGSFRGSQAKSILARIHGQTLKVIIRTQGDESPPKTVAWLIEEIVRLYSCDSVTGGSPIVRRLTHNGVSLKPIQIAEDVLGDLAPDEALEAHVDGWTRKPLLARYQAHCTALGQTPIAAVVTRLASKHEAEEEVELPSCGLTDDSAGPVLAALDECESLTLLNLSQNALGNSTVHRIQELLASQPDLGFSLDLHANQLGPGALTQLSRCPIVLSRLEVLDLSGNRLTDAAGRHLATLLEKGSALMSLSLDNCGLATRTFTAFANALRPNIPLTTLRIGHNNPVAGSALTVLVEKLASLGSFSELDIAGVSADPSAAAAIGRFLCRSQTLQTLNLADTTLRDAGAAALANALAAGDGATCSSIDLSGCHFTPLQAAPLCVQLTRNASLTSLSLRGNKLGEQAASTLRRSISEPTSCLRQLDVSSCGLAAGTLVELVGASAAAGSLEELRLAANCDFSTNSDVTKPSGSGGHRPANDQEIVPESEEEDECEWRHQPRGSQRSNESSKKSDLGTGETGPSGQPASADRNRKAGARSRATGQGFHALLIAVRSAESLKVLDLSENGLVNEEYKKLKEVFETNAQQLEDCWTRGLLRKL